MEYREIEIVSPIKLPYKLIEINFEASSLILSFVSFDLHQSDYSILHGGIAGKFGIEIHEDGLDANFIIDITIGNAFSFYKSLQSCYKTLDGTAQLSDYSSKRTCITVKFTNQGHCTVSGFARNMSNKTIGTLYFEFICDQSYFHDSLEHFALLFDELARLQGFNNFEY